MPKKITLQLDADRVKLLEILCLASGTPDPETGKVVPAPAREVVGDALVHLYRDLMKRASEIMDVRPPASEGNAGQSSLLVDSSGAPLAPQGAV
jgi:hypothetical protein